MFAHEVDKAVEAFKEFSIREITEDHFITLESKLRNQEEDTILWLVTDFLELNQMDLESLQLKSNRQKRDILIKQLSFEHGLSIRQIASLLGLNRGIIYNIIRDSG